MSKTKTKEKAPTLKEVPPIEETPKQNNLENYEFDFVVEGKLETIKGSGVNEDDALKNAVSSLKNKAFRYTQKFIKII